MTCIITAVEVDRVDEGFWTTTRIALVSAAGAVLLIVLVTLVAVAVGVACLKGKKRQKTHPNKVKMEM